MTLDQAKAKLVLDALMTLVSEETTPYTSLMTPDLLNAEEYDRLSELLKRLTPTPNNENEPVTPIHNGQEDEQSGEISTISLSDTPERRGRGRPSKRPKLEHEGKLSVSWFRLHDLGKMELDISLQKLIKENPSHEAASFLHSCSLTFHPLAEQGNPTTGTVAKLCIPLRGRLPTSVIDNVRWLFQALVLGDMVMFLQGSDKLTGATKQDVRDAATEFYTEDTAFIGDVLVIACNVVFVCRHFGTGSLFWLRPCFTRDFLKNKITKAGAVFEETKANFTQRQFDQKIEQSGANQLGDSIRAHLRGIYGIDPAPDLINS